MPLGGDGRSRAAQDLPGHGGLRKGLSRQHFPMGRGRPVGGSSRTGARVSPGQSSLHSPWLLTEQPAQSLAPGWTAQAKRPPLCFPKSQDQSTAPWGPVLTAQGPVSGPSSDRVTGSNRHQPHVMFREPRQPRNPSNAHSWQVLLPMGGACNLLLKLGHFLGEAGGSIRDTD